MIRSYTLPTLAAGIIVASSGVINSSEVAAQGKAGMALPTCAGAGELTLSRSAVGPGFNDPNACLLQALADGLRVIAEEVLVNDPVVVIEAVEASAQVVEAAAQWFYDANVQMVADTQDLYYAAEYAVEQLVC